MYFYEFIGIAQQHGLQYLGESLFHSMMSSNYPEKVAATLEEISNNILELEQYMDFLRNRRFRCTLLCHREVKLQRAVELPPVAKMKVAFWFDPEDPDHTVVTNKTQWSVGDRVMQYKNNYDKDHWQPARRARRRRR